MTLFGEGRVAIGLQLPVAAQSSIFVEPWEATAGVDEIAAIAKAADELGFAYLGVCDHVAVPRDKAARMGTIWYDPIATLGFLAGITARIRLLTHVYVAPLRHPLVAAKQLATLDALSHGRAILGVGVGHLPEEYALARVDYHRRGRLLDETIDAVRAAFAAEYPQHHGKEFAFADLGVAPRPVQAGGPPIWVGGSSPAALKRAAERGDGWIPQGTPRDQLPGQIQQLLAQRRRVRGDEPIDLGAQAEPLYVGQPAWDLGRYSRAGSGAEHAERINALADLGVTHVQVRLRSRSAGELLDQLAAFAAEVMPHLAVPRHAPQP